MRVGVGLDEIVRFNAARGAYGPGRTDNLVADRLESLLNHEEPIRLRLQVDLAVLEHRARMSNVDKLPRALRRR